MFKYLNPISKSLKRININNSVNMTFISYLNNKSSRNTIYSNSQTYSLNKISNKNIFSKFFNKEKNKEEDNSKSEVKTIKDLRYQDKDGKLNSNIEEANEGEYNFSYNTETDRTSNYGENDIDEVPNNPEESLEATFSKEFLNMENISTNQKKIKQSRTFHSTDTDNNFIKFAKLIEYNLAHSTPSIVNQYENLNFEKDLASFVNEMNSLGFSNQLLRSIFRKK